MASNHLAVAAEDRTGTKLVSGLLSGFIGYHLRVAQITAFRDFEAKLTEFSLAPRYFGLLVLIESNPGAPQRAFAEAIHLDPSSLVPIIDNLEKAALVERRVSTTDRRLKGVWLTRKGERLLSKLTPLALEHEARLVLGFSPHEKKLLLELLRRVGENLEVSAASDGS